MSDRDSFIPAGAIVPNTTELRENAERREYILARIQTADGGNLTIKEARELGVSETELTAYAIRFLTKNIKEGYGLDTVRSIAVQSGVVTREEVDALFESLMAAKNAAEVVVETDAERIAREAKEAAWLAEMLELCGEK